jgi:hypothetical protein|tara:strand:+ start:1122 stop:1352 length:231 start_codon:yes stop_codon:yes gene_type:complete
MEGVDLSNSTPYVCEKCGHDTFVTAFKLRTVSALMSPTGDSMMVPIQVFACVDCGHINEEFLPKDLPEDENGLTLS